MDHAKLTTALANAQPFMPVQETAALRELVDLFQSYEGDDETIWREPRPAMMHCSNCKLNLPFLFFPVPVDDLRGFQRLCKCPRCHCTKMYLGESE